MKLYKTKEETPLAFYKFYRAIIPVGIIFSIYSIISVLVNKNMAVDWYNISRNLVYMVFDIFIFYGLLKWKPNTVYLILIQYIIGVIGNINNIINYTPTSLPVYIISFIIGVLLNYLTIVYFYKRKLLFDGIPYKIPAHNATYNQRLNNYYAETENHEETRELCECGFPRPSPDYLFCPNCGKEYANK